MGKDMEFINKDGKVVEINLFGKANNGHKIIIAPSRTGMSLNQTKANKIDVNKVKK